MDGDAYSIGQVIGLVARWGILIAATVATVQRFRSGRYGGQRAAATLAVLGALMVGSVVYDSGRAQASGSLGDQRGAMMASCTGSGQAESYCACIWDSLQDAGLDTSDELDAMQARVAPGVMPPEVASAARACS